MNNGFVDINLSHIQNIAPHTHNALECILVLKGSLTVEINGKRYDMNIDDLVVVNPKDIHSYFSQETNLVLLLRIDQKFFETECKDAGKYKFQCNTKLEQNAERFFDLKRIVTRMFLICFKKQEGYQLEFNAMLLHFLLILIRYFSPRQTAECLPNSTSTDISINKALEYITQNYFSNLCLSDAAKLLYMSPQYFSKYFKRKTGLSFLGYIKQIRLEHAVSDLLHTDASILKIAMNNGFPNAKSFSAAFSEMYNISPGEYRKSNSALAKVEFVATEAAPIEEQLHDDMISLIRYMQNHDLQSSIVTSFDEVVIKIEQCAPKRLQKPLKIVSIERLETLMQSECMQQIRILQSDLQFQMLYLEEFDLDYIKLGSDRLQYIHYPFCQCIHELCHLGLALIIRLDLSHIISVEVDGISTYLNRLSIFLDVFKNSFSAEYTNTCCFELNCTDIEDLPQFAEFYLQVERLLVGKKMNCQLGINLPDWALEEADSLFFAELKTVIESKASIAFAGFKSYPMHVFAQDNNSNDLHWQNFHRRKVQKIENLLSQWGLSGIPLYLTHWNTLAGRNQAEAGAFFRSALIIHSILQLHDSIAGIGFNLNTRLLPDFSASLDFGILSVFLMQATKRPLYFVLEAWNRMHNKLLFHGENVALTYDGGSSYAMVVFQPHYIDPLYSVDQYFIEHEIKVIPVTIQGLAKGRYRIKRFIYDKGSAGAFSRWSVVGLPDFSDPDVMHHVQNSIHPDLFIYEENIKDSYTFHTELTFNGIVLYIIQKM